MAHNISIARTFTGDTGEIFAATLKSVLYGRQTNLHIYLRSEIDQLKTNFCAKEDGSFILNLFYARVYVVDDSPEGYDKPHPDDEILENTISTYHNLSRFSRDIQGLNSYLSDEGLSVVIYMVGRGVFDVKSTDRADILTRACNIVSSKISSAIDTNKLVSKLLQESDKIKFFVSNIKSSDRINNELSDITEKIARYHRDLETFYAKKVNFELSLEMFNSKLDNFEDVLSKIRSHPLVDTLSMIPIDSILEIGTVPIMLSVTKNSNMPIGQYRISIAIGKIPSSEDQLPIVITHLGSDIQVNIHPHIGPYICWGGFSYGLRKRLVQLELIGLLDDLKLFLEAYNPSSRLRNLEQVMDSFGITVVESAFFSTSFNDSGEASVSEDDLLIRPDEIGRVGEAGVEENPFQNQDLAEVVRVTTDQINISNTIRRHTVDASGLYIQVAPEQPEQEEGDPQDVQF